MLARPQVGKGVPVYTKEELLAYRYPLHQIYTRLTPDLHEVLACRYPEEWRVKEQ